MIFRIAVCLAFATMFIGTALGQGNQNWQSSPPQATPPTGSGSYQPSPQVYGQPAAGQPNQPGPPMVRQPQGQAIPMPMQPPWWPLAPQEQQYLDQVLAIWEQYGDRVQVFETKFILRKFGPDLASHSPKPVLQSEEKGVLKYQKPDKGLYEIQGDRPLKWICDGRSFFEYDFGKSELIQQILPPDMQGGRALADGPVPFVFGAKADRLKELYWIRWLRPNTPNKENDNELCLEVWPRTQKGAADFRRAYVILSRKDMQPVAIERHAWDGQETTGPDGRVVMVGASYEQFLFRDTIINPKNPLRILEGDPFKPRLDRGWKVVVEQPTSDHPPAQQAGQQAGRR